MLLLIQDFSQIKMKIAEVRPLCKQGDKMPKITHQSILLVFSKILEKLMYNRLKSYLNKHNILSEAQNAFREIKST
jgi:hypothetical protein